VMDESIQKLDEKILKLLNQRARKMLEQEQNSGKKASSAALTADERKWIRTLAEKNSGPYPSSALEPVFREIELACRQARQFPPVYFLGPNATNTHAAAVIRFGQKADFYPLIGLTPIFREVEKDKSAFGVVPIENSSEGVVGLTMDLLLESPLSICGEIYLPIRHLLLANIPKSKIEKVYSHPQAIAQCRGWLSRHLPAAEVIETASTSRGVEMALKDKKGAAIAGPLAAKMYKIRVAARDIHDRSGNTTRFVVLGHRDAEPTGKDKTSLIFLVKNRAGALYDALYPFREHQINLSKIESRPTKREAWEYAFYVDLVGHRTDKEVQKALKELEEQSVYMKILGSYPSES
jgi:chorismate mutase / prephenate dehydratase